MFSVLRYHLQALRHLYVLGAEPRLLVPVDVDTNTPCYALIEVTYKVTVPVISVGQVILKHFRKGDDSKLNSHKKTKLPKLLFIARPCRLALMFGCSFWHYQLFFCHYS